MCIYVCTRVVCACAFVLCLFVVVCVICVCACEFVNVSVFVKCVYLMCARVWCAHVGDAHMRFCCACLRLCVCNYVSACACLIMLSQRCR